MRLIIFMLLCTLTQNSLAGEIYVADGESEGYRFDISGEGGVCGLSPVCINVYKTLKNNEVKVKSFPFEKECYLTLNGKKIRPDADGYGGEFDRKYNGFSCYSKGHTPLAGATYKAIKFGRSSNACEESDILGSKFICIKGCKNPIVPEYMNGSDGTC